MLREDLDELPVIDKNNRKKLVEYLKVTIAQSVKETLHVIYLNKKYQIVDEYTQEGTVDKAPLYPREIVDRAFQVGATTIIISHNHLGEAKPPKQDESLTRTLSLACSTMNIEFIDHIIVTKKNYFSFAENKLL